VIRAAGALACLAVVLAGCGRGDDTAPAAAAAAAPPVPTRADPAPGRVLDRFTAAARRADARALWGLLSSPTRASMLARSTFAAGAGASLTKSLGRIDRPYRVVLSRRVGARYAVAALAGTRTEDGEREPYAYGAALVREPAGWRVELDAAALSRLRPDTDEDEASTNVRVAARAAAGAPVRTLVAWLDRRPLALRVDRTGPFVAEVEATVAGPLRAGRHDVVVFARSREGAAAAAWPFRVKE
jgi:hypothetical protein